MITEGTRMSLYIVFLITFGFLNFVFDWTTMYGYLLLCTLVLIVVKLTDLTEAVKEMRY